MQRRVLLPALICWCAAALGPVARATQPSPATRLNNLVSLLDADQAIFGIFVNTHGEGGGPQDAIRHATNPNLDFVVYDLEHAAFDISGLSQYLQWLLDRGRIAKQGRRAEPAVVVRLPVNAREQNEWMIKNVLDRGVHGLVFPHTETAEQALHAIQAMRYPQVAGVADFEPAGQRGHSSAAAARYWGLTPPEYVRFADIWRLDPDGHLVPIFLIENALGVANVREIAKTLADRRIGAVLWAGTGDLSLSLGGSPGASREAVDQAVNTILAAGKEFGIPVCVNGTANLERRMQQGARVFVGGVTAESRTLAGR